MRRSEEYVGHLTLLGLGARPGKVYGPRVSTAARSERPGSLSLAIPAGGRLPMPPCDFTAYHSCACALRAGAGASASVQAMGIAFATGQREATPTDPGPVAGWLAIIARPRPLRLGGWRNCGWKLRGLAMVVLELDEVVELGCSGRRRFARPGGSEFVSFPIPDRGVPETRAISCRDRTRSAPRSGRLKRRFRSRPEYRRFAACGLSAPGRLPVSHLNTEAIGAEKKAAPSSPRCSSLLSASPHCRPICRVYRRRTLNGWSSASLR